MSIARRDVLLGSLGVAAGAVAQTPPPNRAGDIVVPSDPVETIDLWPGGAPGAGGLKLVETVDERSKEPVRPDRAVYGITRPRLVVFRPDRPNGKAVLAIPGGGYRWVVIDKEGYEIGQWLAARGWTVFVLFYRLPGEGWPAGPDVALADAQRAIRLIRARAVDFGIDRERVMAVGFSAGGHLCGDLATRHDVAAYDPVDKADRLSARPDLAALIYAVQSMSRPLAHPGSRALLLGSDPSPALETAHTVARNVTAATPPCFLLHAQDDAVVSAGNTLDMHAALVAARVPVDMHLFAEGGHGFGLRRIAGKPASVWPELLDDWATYRFGGSAAD